MPGLYRFHTLCWWLALWCVHRRHWLRHTSLTSLRVTGTSSGSLPSTSMAVVVPHSPPSPLLSQKVSLSLTPSCNDDNEYVDPLYCGTEMYAGRVAWWVTVSMPMGQTDGRTDGRQTVTLRFPLVTLLRGQRNDDVSNDSSRYWLMIKND